jgi:hypothetical protein
MDKENKKKKNKQTNHFAAAPFCPASRADACVSLKASHGHSHCASPWQPLHAPQ